MSCSQRYSWPTPPRSRVAHGGMQMEPPTVFLPCPLPVSTRGYSSVLGGQSWDCSIFSAKRLAGWGFFLLVGWLVLVLLLFLF